MGVIIRNGIEYSGAGMGGGSCDCDEIVYLTQEEYDALPETKESNNVEYRITNANTHVNAARDWAYDNSESGLEAETVQDAIDEVAESLEANGNQFYFDYKDGKYGFNTDPNRGADTFSPFKSMNVVRGTDSQNVNTSGGNTVILGNIGIGKTDVIVAVDNVQLRCNNGDYGTVRIDSTGYDSSNGNIYLKVSSTTTTGAYWGCKWIAVYN